MSLTIAIVGRPNVGKSTLFNRLVGRRAALVDNVPGVTRDRREAAAQLGDLVFTVIDTPGLEQADPDSLPGRMLVQTNRAIAQADAVLFLIDGRVGPTPLDRAFADRIRGAAKPIVVVANKSEGRLATNAALEAYALGLGDPVAISAEHGEGLSELYDALLAIVPPPRREAAAPASLPAARAIRLAVVGRPNSGKSTLVNRLLGEDRLLTGPEPGLTRDAVGVNLTWQGQKFCVYDTAGLRRRARIAENIERLSVSDALRAIRFAEVVVLLLDARAPYEEQDLRIADLIEREGRAVVLGMNKWDLLQGNARPAKLREEVDHWLPQLEGVPVVPLSGLLGQGLEALMQAVLASYEAWNRRIATPALNRWLSAALAAHPPPAIHGRRVRIRYMTQPKIRPPSFVLFCTRADAVPQSYRRYLINGLRRTFKLAGAPLRLQLREQANPYASRA